ncbi:MAG TPA: UDP-glucose 4-epimerase GalE [Bacteroidia bacterium]|nr:UDP-glucose 4-epimerase GalE [Bacteroidia bacterium]
MKKVLITGGAGYIGSHTIIEMLENTDWEPISADNYSNSSAITFDRIKEITGKAVTNYVVDLCDAKGTHAIFEKNPDIAGIIHFAAFKSVPESVEKPLLYYHNNIESLVNILACSKEFKVPHIIFSSSCSVYGDIEKLPVNEDTPISKAESPYGFTKQIGEQALSDFAKVTDSVKTVALRYFNPVGAHRSGKIGEVPAQRPNNLVPMITQTAIGKQKEVIVFGDDYKTRDGTCIRDYVHVCDIAKAHISALKYLDNDKNAPKFSILNLGTGNGVSVMEMIKTFEKVSGVKLNYRIGPRRLGDVVAIYSDMSLVKKTLGWTPQYNLDEMMSSAWEWEQNLKKIKVFL